MDAVREKNGIITSVTREKEKKPVPLPPLPFLPSEGRVLEARHDRTTGSGYRAVTL